MTTRASIHPSAATIGAGVRTLVVVPTYNERENLPSLVRALMLHAGTRVMVVDDRSPDGTGAVAEELAAEFPGRVEVLHRTGKKGLGRSYVEALLLARTRDVDLVCQMDADGSHDPQYLPALVAATTDGTLDLVIGSRYVDGVSVVNWPLRRLILSTFANRYIRALTHLPVNDCTSGFRCWRRAALSRVPLERIVSDGYAFLVEMLFEAQRSGCQVGEVPIIFVERRLGQSKMSRGVVLESILIPWRLALRKAFASARSTRPAARRLGALPRVPIIRPPRPLQPGEIREKDTHRDLELSPSPP